MKVRLFLHSVGLYFFIFFTSFFLISSPCFAMQDLPSVERCERDKGRITHPIPIVHEAEDVQSVLQPALQMPFKLGFEFQESSGLCSWASDNFNVQKKSLFFLCSSRTGNKLWHVEIDTDDIEFVTRPFTYSERDELAECIETIIMSANCLKEKLTEDISFQTWMRALKLLFQDRIKRDILGFPFWDSVPYGIKKPRLETWNPSFSPQATIQHPLEDTIFLYFGLLGFQSFTTANFAHSLPYRNQFKEAHSEANAQKLEEVVGRFRSKVGGLMFLQALTLICMAPVDSKVTDKELLQETQEMFNQSKQVDPKLKLPIMSRRPFSEMVSNTFLPEQKKKISPLQFVQGFIAALGMNTLTGIPSYLHKTNYAEQFFDEEGGQALNLTRLLSCFEDHLVQENKGTLLYLLEKGIVSTLMLRNLKPEFDSQSSPIVPLLNDPLPYFYSVVGSVFEPTHRYKINPNSGHVAPLLIKEPSPKDGLSPPWFLDSDNSMGTLESSTVDLHYGEAVIEVRSIREAGSWFLRKMSIQGRKAGFLGRIDQTLIDDSLCLFDFLNKFGHNEYCYEILLGITHAVYTDEL